MRLYRLLVLLPPLLLAGMAEAAQTNDPASEKGAFSILFENDIFYNSDHDYTNGVEFAYTTAPDDTPGWAERATPRACFTTRAMCAPVMPSARTSSRPHNLSLTNPPLTDRPYAGFLYGALGLVEDTGIDLDQLQFTLGRGRSRQRWRKKPRRWSIPSSTTASRWAGAPSCATSRA